MSDPVTQEQFNAMCRQKFSIFAPKAFTVLEPSTDYQHNWHVDCIAEHLQAVWDKEIQNIIINMPPRLLKTILCSVAFPAWGFNQDPSIKFMLTSFKFERAKSMTRKTKQIMNSPWYQRLCPHVELSRDQNEKHYFETTSYGHYYSAAMSSVTGEGADIQVCDDPLSPDEAASPVQRKNAIDTIRGTLFSRFNDPRTGRFILVQQRLNEDDPTGELLKDDGFYHLKLPAEAINTSYSYSINDKEWSLEDGELLFPDRFTREVLDRKKAELGSYNYAGQMLQEPVPLGGGEIKRDWLNYYASKSFDPTGSNIYILVDPSSGKENAILNDLDFTAMAVVACAPDQNFYLIDGLKERLNPTERVDKLFELHKKWNGLTRVPPRVGYEDIGMQSDMHYIKVKQKEDSYRFPIKPLPPKGEKRLSKIHKIRRLIPDMERGRWWLPNDIYYKDYKGLPRNFMSDIVEEEFLLFPFAPHDDFLEDLSFIYDMAPIFPKVGTVDVTDGLDWGRNEVSVFDI